MYIALNLWLLYVQFILGIVPDCLFPIFKLKFLIGFANAQDQSYFNTKQLISIDML
jgi:hypothetical protein